MSTARSEAVIDIDELSSLWAATLAAIMLEVVSLSHFSFVSFPLLFFLLCVHNYEITHMESCSNQKSVLFYSFEVFTIILQCRK
jgi:hypothetical protein